MQVSQQQRLRSTAHGRRQISKSCPSRARHCVRTRAKNEEDTDLVTRLVGKLFGKAAVDDRTPMGLKRMDWSKVKDLECVMDRTAAPVESDDPYMAMVRPLLAGTSLEDEPLRCAYSANEDGWAPGDFHSRVQGYGACIVLARSAGGAVFGGYNPLGFDGYGADKSSMGAFLFTWPDGNTKGGDPLAAKLPKVGTDQLAVIDRMDQGPQFGPGDLKILLTGGKANRSKASSKLIDYKRPPGGGKTLFAVGEGAKTELVELRAYVRKGGKLKYELDGVRWKSRYVKDGSGEGPPPGIFGM